VGVVVGVQMMELQTVRASGRAKRAATAEGRLPRREFSLFDPQMTQIEQILESHLWKSVKSVDTK
jgi:O-methyltransferase involved in polyketide biosynthesis